MTTEDNKTLTRIAHIVSDTFSPILMPTIAMAAALWLTVLRFLPLDARLWSLAGIFAISGLIPFFTILGLIKLGRVSDASISDRSQRLWPYLTSIVCYVGAGLYVSSLHAPVWMSMFFYGAAAVSSIATIITVFFKWKISAHEASVGGVAGIVYWLGRSGMIEQPLVWFSVFVIIAGLVAWSRLYLDRHTPLQVMAGGLLGFVVELAMLSIL